MLSAPWHARRRISSGSWLYFPGAFSRLVLFSFQGSGHEKRPAYGGKRVQLSCSFSFAFICRSHQTNFSCRLILSKNHISVNYFLRFCFTAPLLSVIIISSIKYTPKNGGRSWNSNSVYSVSAIWVPSARTLSPDSVYSLSTSLSLTEPENATRTPISSPYPFHP